MKRLKWFLGAVYVVLILLLLLRSCDYNAVEPARPTPPEPSVPEPDPVPPADTTAERRAEGVGERGELKVTLLWDFPGDIDLHVKQPNGNTISYKSTKDSSTGGALDVDNQAGGRGSAENIFWSTPISGTYSVKLVYYGASSSTGAVGRGDCSVVVFQQGRETQTYKVAMSRVKEEKHVVKIEVE